MNHNPIIGLSFPCPENAPCKINLTSGQLVPNTVNQFDPNIKYYLPYGTLVFKDKDTGEYLFDLTGTSQEGIPCDPIVPPNITNNLEGSYIDDFIFVKVNTDFNTYFYHTQDIDITYPNDGWLFVAIKENITINGRLHTTDQDGVLRSFRYAVPANTTLSIRSTSKNIIVANY